MYIDLVPKKQKWGDKKELQFIQSSLICQGNTMNSSSDSREKYQRFSDETETETRG